jgi:lipopolysaccharide transport system permease protein
MVDNAGLVKRISVPREIVPITSVLANCLHLFIQIVVLLLFVVLTGVAINIHWLWLPVVWILEIIFVCGLALFFAAINVYVRDTRYVVESATLVLFWLVPIIYDFSMIPAKYRDIYQYNPLAALILAMREVLLMGIAPPATLLSKLTAVSIASFVIGWVVFRRLKSRFYDYL